MLIQLRLRLMSGLLYATSLKMLQKTLLGLIYFLLRISEVKFMCTLLHSELRQLCDNTGGIVSAKRFIKWCKRRIFGNFFDLFVCTGRCSLRRGKNWGRERLGVRWSRRKKHCWNCAMDEKGNWSCAKIEIGKVRTAENNLLEESFGESVSWAEKKNVENGLDHIP